MNDDLSFIKLVLKMLETLIRENETLKVALDRAEEQLKQYRNMETTLRETLMEALHVVEDYKKNARLEAELIIKEAEIKANHE